MWTFVNIGVDVDDTALLRRAYDEVLVPAFPEASLLESFEQIVENIVGDDTMKTFVTLVFADTDFARERVSAVVLFEYFYASNVFLLTYLVTHPSTKGHGVAMLLGVNAFEQMTAYATSRGHAAGFDALFVGCVRRCLSS